MIKSLIAVLKNGGWELGKYNSEVLLFVKKFPHTVFGSLSYTVRIVANGSEDIESRKFKLCQLIGPTRNARTGAFCANSVLGEWRSLVGAVDGLIPKFEASRRDYAARESKFMSKSKK